MKKSDLKIGQLVVLRDGEMCIIMPDNNDELVLVHRFKDYIMLEDYNDNMTYKSEKVNMTGLDIMEVYSRNYAKQLLTQCSTDHRVSLWKRQNTNNDWLKLSDTPPAKSGAYPCITRGGNICLLHYTKTKNMWRSREVGTIISSDDIIRWCPIPDIPNDIEFSSDKEVTE